MAGYYSRPAQLARQMRQLLFPRRCPCCRRVLGTLPLCEVCTPRLEELRRGPVMRLDVSRHYLGALDGAAAPYRYEGVVRSAILCRIVLGGDFSDFVTRWHPMGR